MITQPMANTSTPKDHERPASPDQTMSTGPQPRNELTKHELRSTIAMRTTQPTRHNMLRRHCSITKVYDAQLGRREHSLSIMQQS